jgi:hypothetical protein
MKTSIVIFCFGLISTVTAYSTCLKKKFFYVPKGPESFIWTDVHYNPQNNILAVSGCFWACPYGLILLDFSNPMAETKWVDVLENLDGVYDLYDGLDFVSWEDEKLIVKADKIVEVDGTETVVPVEIKINKTQYSKWLKD